MSQSAVQNVESMEHYMPYEKVKDLLSDKVKQAHQSFGPFKYDDHALEQALGEREYREIVLLEDGSQYAGEWLCNTSVR